MLTRYQPFFAEDALRSFWPLLAMPAGAPSADLLETEDAFEIVIDLPGFALSDIEVEAQDRQIVIKGRRTTAGGAIIELARTFQLEGCAPDSATASLENGVLRVRVPKGVAKEAKRIEVTGGRERPSLFDRVKRAISGMVRGDFN
jgi:HSP20 family protein